MHLRGIAAASVLVALATADAARADRALIVIDARPREERAALAPARIADALRGPGLDVVRHVAAELPAGLAQAAALLERASDALTRFRDQEALELVTQAEEALSDADLARPEARDLLVRLNWIAARSQLALGRPALADAACRLAHALAPDRQLPRAELAPAFVERCEQVARRASRSLPLTVTVEPPAARVSLDLVAVDLKAELTASEGDHYLGVEASGHLSVLRRVTVSEHAHASSIALQPMPPERRLGRAVAAAAAGHGSWAAISHEVTRARSGDIVVVVLGAKSLAALDDAGRRIFRGGSAEEARLAIVAHVQMAPTGSLDTGPPSGRPWYRSGWVWVGIVAGAGIVAGSSAWLLRDQRHVIDNWSLSP